MPHRQIKRRATTAPMVRPASPHRERGLAMLRAGATAAQVAAELGVPLRTVEKWSASLAIRQRGERGASPSPRTNALPVIDLLLQGVPSSEIAAAFKRTRQAIETIRNRWISDEDSSRKK